MTTATTCEMCGERQGRPSCVDDNYETYLCGPCRKALTAAGEKVEVMDLD